MTSHRKRGFTMVELMTVLTIITILITIVIPVVSTVRKKAAAAAVSAQLSAIASAIDRYHQEFGAYPGPLPDNWLYPASPAPNIVIVVNGASVGPVSDGTNKFITSSENLVLGLCGGLIPPPAGSPANTPFGFDSGLVGNGPRNLNPFKPKRYDPFLEISSGSQKLLTQRPDTSPNATAAPFVGDYSDGAGEGWDSPIPEILDRFGNPMPILYLRPRVGANGVVSIGGTNGTLTAPGTPIIGTDANGNPIPTQYDLNQIAPYVRQYNNRSIGEGKSLKAKEYVNAAVSPTSDDFPHGLQSVDETYTLNKTSRYPYDAFPYFVNRQIPPTNPAVGFANQSGTPKQKDKYILISAGIDRVYGTADDITQFGAISD